MGIAVATSSATEIEKTPSTIETLWHGALTRALTSGVAVYEMLYVELAERERVPMVKFDEKVLKTFPSIARRPRDLE